jgi:hypothetical protein
MVGAIYNGFCGEWEGGSRLDMRAGASLKGMKTAVAVGG